MKVYLAGPDVFLPNAKAVLAQKAALARAAGFTPLVPGDLAIPPTRTPYEKGVAISAVNEGMMREADMIVANLTPYRGVSADVGTVYELGFMCALGRHVYAYTNDARGLYERTVTDYYQGAVTTGADGRHAGPDGLMVEDCDMADNLMLDGGIAARGGSFVRRAVAEGETWTDCTAFEECLATAARRHLGS